MPVKESLIPPSTPLWAKLVVLNPKKSPVVDSRRIFSWAAALRGGGGWRNGARTESQVGIPTAGFLSTLDRDIESLGDSGVWLLGRNYKSNFCFGPFPLCACNLAPGSWAPAPEKLNITCFVGQCSNLSFTQFLLCWRVEHHMFQLLGLDPSALLWLNCSNTVLYQTWPQYDKKN